MSFSYVYFILDENSKKIKIGKANDVQERISSLQTGNPNPLKIRHIIECKSEQISFLLEKQYHEKFKHLRGIGEWFDYDENLFEEFILNQSNIQVKKKRQPLVISTLFGEETFVDIELHPRCYFYPECSAQIKDSYENSLKLSMPYRTMAWPTDGKQMLLPFSTETNRVFISTKKHNENLKQKRFETKFEKSTLWSILNERTTIVGREIST